MSFIQCRNIFYRFISLFSIKTKKDFSSLSDELILEIFSHLNLAELGTICRVSKEWKRLGSDPLLWKRGIYREIAFGNDKWAQCFGKEVVKDEEEDFSSLPFEAFIEDCRKFQSIFPEKKGKDRLMLVRLPKTLNGGLTLKSLGELAKRRFSKNHRVNRPVRLDIDAFEDRSIDKSRWLLITTDVLPRSKDKAYLGQLRIVAQLAEKSLINYEVPDTLEAVACILSHYFDSNIRLFSDNPKTYTRCKDQTGFGSRTTVGGFAPGRLHVGVMGTWSECTGMAALRKFPSPLPVDQLAFNEELLQSELV